MDGCDYRCNKVICKKKKKEKEKENLEATGEVCKPFLNHILEVFLFFFFGFVNAAIPSVLQKRPSWKPDTMEGGG